MLTGKHSREGEVQKGRFHKNANYSDRFYKPDVFDALDKIKAACAKADMSMIQVCFLIWNLWLTLSVNNGLLIQATYSWMMHHSQLGAEGDGVLIGASTFEQLEQNLQGWHSKT